MATDFTELLVWQKARELLREIVSDTKILDRNFICKTVADQLFRSGSSVSANIAEGFGRKSGREFMRSCIIARGEIDECRNWYLQCSSLKLLPDDVVKKRNVALLELRKMITCFIARMSQQ